MARRYVYALMDSHLAPLRVFGRTIEITPVEDVFVAAARVDDVPEVSEKVLREQHAIVTRLATRASAILPMRFGALVDDETLQQAVASHRASVHDALSLVRGREQMTVRLFGDPCSGPAANTGPVRSGTEYLQRRLSVMELAGLPELAVIRRAVTHLVAAERSEAGRGTLRATMWHLIDRGRSRRYRSALAPLAPTLLPLQIAVTGPWPPFAFAPELCR
jgi:hypothetical protein